MRDGLDLLFDPGFDAAGRLGVDGPLVCRRAWPFGDHGWVALLGSEELTPADTWALLRPALLKPGQSWPSAVRRMHDGPSRGLLDQGIAAWSLETEPVVAGLGDWLAPSILGLPEDLERGRVVGYKPLRRVVTRFAGADGRALYFSKHLRPTHVARCAENHQLIENWWKGSGEFRLPPLERVAATSGYLVWRAVPGVPLRHTDDRQALAAATHAAGRCLASLHRCPAPLVNIRTRESELRTIEAWFDALRPVVALPSRLDHGLSALREAAGWAPPARPVLSHGDFHDGQILVDPPHTTLLDLDTLTMAEPELDVGNFLAHLDLLALDQPGVSAADLERVVLEAYAQGRGPLLSVPRVTWYRAAAALRLVFVHAPRPESRHLLPRLASRAMHLALGLWMSKEEVAS